ncbi:hypothetical protein PoB_003008200 [Plakobranchus ocellatus]|uniref:Uncharacterized protein n=1 Tax=Plakobranchus ocellatus TaxID=259542 RepID=A0AAV4A8K9_9GAST|nr:hypothetical protein PoB_003008200 [Plakobranchus ocellatus]
MKPSGRAAYDDDLGQVNIESGDDNDCSGSLLMYRSLEPEYVLCPRDNDVQSFWPGRDLDHLTWGTRCARRS